MGGSLCLLLPLRGEWGILLFGCEKVLQNDYKVIYYIQGQ